MAEHGEQETGKGRTGMVMDSHEEKGVRQRASRSEKTARPEEGRRAGSSEVKGAARLGARRIQPFKLISSIKLTFIIFFEAKPAVEACSGLCRLLTNDTSP